MPVPDSLDNNYRGRFAPSPTGDLHMGSLVAAMASYLEARTRSGEWFLRIEDLDPPREVPGSAERIIRTLETLGFEWDGDVVYQSTRRDAYEESLRYLLDRDLAFPCACSRSEVAATASRQGPEGPVYPGTCRDGIATGRDARSVRMRAPDHDICFEDRLQGRTCQDIGRDIGDFVILRADGFFAYQLAVVVDDAATGITDIVRGADLLLSTPRQIWLQQQLGLPQPSYLHIPLLFDDTGHKLSKQARSLPVDPARPGAALYNALCLLRQAPPAALARAKPHEIREWAVKHWQPRALHGIHDLSMPLTDPR